MNPRHMKVAISGLRWVLGLVILLESAHFALSHEAGLPQWIPPALGGSEMLAALLFLVPAARQFGGYILLLIFALALALHILLGQYSVGHLFVYGMAVWVGMIYRNNVGVGAPQ